MSQPLRMSRTLSWIAAALLLSAAAPASAQKGGAAAGAQADPGGAPSAQGLYAAAQKLFDKGNYAEALIAFRQAYNASSSPNARLMIGQCLIGLGRTADAYEEMAATLAEAKQRAESEAKYAPTRDAAAAQVALLEPKVGKVVIEIADTGAEVTLNGARLAREKLGAPIAVDPGTVVIAARRADGRTVQKEQAVKAGDTEKVSLVFPEGPKKIDAPPIDTAPPIETPPPEAPKGLGTVRAAGIAVAGVGVAGLAVFGITGAMAQGKFSQLEKECGSERCADPKYADVVDSGKTLSTVSTVSLVAGAAALAGGGLMIVFGGPRAPAPAAAPAGAEKPEGARSGHRSTAAAPPKRAASAPPPTTLTISPAGAGARITVTF